MWDIANNTLDSNAIGQLEPIEPLYEFEGELLTFVARHLNGDLLLVHNLCVSDGTSRYLVSAVDHEILAGLKAGRIDLHDALRQPRCWIADLCADQSSALPWRIAALYHVQFDSIPADNLPISGTLLTPSTVA